MRPGAHGGFFPPPTAAGPVREPEPPGTTTVPRPAAPPRSTYPRRHKTPARRPASGRRTRRRRLKGCLLAVVVLYFGPRALNGCMSALDSSLDAGPTPAAGPTGPSRPSRITKKLPGADGKATLVRAYRTSNKQITLCRTGDDRLYYYGSQPVPVKDGHQLPPAFQFHPQVGEKEAERVLGPQRAMAVTGSLEQPRQVLASTVPRRLL